MNTKRLDVRNVAIIAHVDHGKTTLVDQLLKQSGMFRENQNIRERVMDSGDIERERGITILSKNTAITYDDIKINIIDTPGHADFGGEVERILKMVNGVILVVDATDGPMQQTKFVLKNALNFNLPVVICVNKIDRPDSRAKDVVDEVLELFLELDATEDQLDSPVIFASAKKGIASRDLDADVCDMSELFQTIINHIPPEIGNDEDDTKILVSTIDYNEYLGRIGIGKVESGIVKVNDELKVINKVDASKSKKIKITKLYEFEGLNKIEVASSKYGSIVAIAGILDINIGDTICAINVEEALDFVEITQPTISINFSVNDSPFAGLEGKFVTSRHLRERLFKELNTNVSLKVEETDSTESFKVSGRGELHLAILIETMRREGYEFSISKPEVIYKYENDKKLEPFELVEIDVPDEYSGAIIEKLGSRKGELVDMYTSDNYNTKLKINIPSRGLIGYRSEFLTDTKGYGILNSTFNGYHSYKGDISSRQQGSLVAHESGEAVAYGLSNAEARGNLFIKPGTKVYQGMVVGISQRSGDLDVNVCKRKQLTNMRASGSDDSSKLTPPIVLSLEQCISFIADDEIIEVTPINLRIRKKMLDNTMRQRLKKK